MWPELCRISVRVPDLKAENRPPPPGGDSPLEANLPLQLIVEKVLFKAFLLRVSTEAKLAASVCL